MCYNYTITAQEAQAVHNFSLYAVWIQVYAAIALGVIGLLVTVFFIVVVIIGVRRKQLAIHFYYCLLNRSIADAISATSLVIALTAVFFISPSSQSETKKVITIFSSLLYGTFFEATFTLLILLILKIIAIKWPLRYRRLVTHRRILIILGLTWPLTAVVVVVLFIPQLVVWFRRPRGKAEDCWTLYQSPLAFFMSIIPGLIYLTAILACLYVIYLVVSSGRLK